MTDPNGLYYMRARYYHPGLKRFLNRDILRGDITEGQTFNRFAYVNGDPVGFIDPLGLMRCIEGTGKGGRFGDLDKIKGPNEVPHHMAQNAYNKTKGISRNDGPAVLMSKEDHAKTRTFAGKGKATMREDAAHVFKREATYG